MERSRQYQKKKDRMRTVSFAPSVVLGENTKKVQRAKFGVRGGGHASSISESCYVADVDQGEEQRVRSEESPVFIQEGSTGSQWELTWPIWHMLPHQERKEIASRNGYRSIGEFEEFMSLQKAVGISNETSRNCENSYVTLRPLPTSPNEEEKLQESLLAEQLSDEDEDHDGYGSGFEPNVAPVPVDAPVQENTNPFAAADAAYDFPVISNNCEGGGIVAQMPDELHHRIMSYLDLHAYGAAALVHPLWRTFTRTEQAYKIMCQRSYLRQSKRKILSLTRWGSYHNMLTNRPRVRTGGGIYVLKYAHVKKIQRDMWTEVPVGAILETVYYRYLSFHESGTVLYALTPSPPHEMLPKFMRMRVTGEKDRRIEFGRYEVRRDAVRVWADHSWCHVTMDMRIVLHGMEGAWDRFSAIQLERHRTCDVGRNVEDDCGVVEYEVPETEFFRFLKDKRL